MIIVSIITLILIYYQCLKKTQKGVGA